MGSISTNGENKPLRSELHGAPRAKNLPFMLDRWNEHAEKHADKIAVVAYHQRNDLYEDVLGPSPTAPTSQVLRWPFSRLRALTHRFASALMLMGVKNGTPIASFIDNGVEWPMWFWACLILGCPVVPFNPRHLSNHEEISHMLRVSKARVLFVRDRHLAQNIEKDLPDIAKEIQLGIIIDPDRYNIELPSRWMSLTDLLSVSDPDTATSPPKFDYRPDPNDITLIVYTSGTTSLPKGCPNKVGHIAGYGYTYRTRSGINPKSVSCAVMPNNHMIGIVSGIVSLSEGATVVYPAPTFQAKETFKALIEEGVTHIPTVPTVVLAIAQLVEQSGTKPSTLQQLDCSGSAVTPDIMRMASHVIGAKNLGAIFGMSEGTPLRPFPETLESIIVGDHVRVGKVVDGAKLKICAPDSVEPLPRGTLGELHQSGQQLIDGYIGAKNQDGFYLDPKTGERWFRTGDQALMDDEGNVSITGRYKDMIIRGGENISPAAIEKVINKNKGVHAQVVGVPDPIAGELPVAVIGSKSTFAAADLQQAALNALGPAFVPNQFITLEELGLDDFPKTMTGKIQKIKLAGIVKNHLAAQNQVNSLKESHLLATVKQLWSKTLGIPIENLDINASLAEVADSISVMRFQSALKKQTEKSLTVDQLVQNSTIASQMKLLEEMPEMRKKPVGTVAKRAGPLTANDMLHTIEIPGAFNFTHRTIEEILRPMGLGWSDVEGVFPTYDNGQIAFQNRRASSWSYRYPVHTNSSKTALRAALEAALSNNDNIHSLFIHIPHSSRNPFGLHASMKPSKKWFDHCIKDMGTVATIADFKRFKWGDDELDNAKFPGPLVQCLLVDIQETNSAGVVVNGNHSVFDALAMRTFFEDLNKALSNEPSLAPHVPFRLWMETYYSMRESPRAKESAMWHMNQLSQLSKCKSAVWPPFRSPQAFWGASNTNWKSWNPRRASSQWQNPDRQSLNEFRCDDTEGINVNFEIPSIKTIRQRYPHITAPVIVKSAQALLNVHYTQSTHALFMSPEAARSSLPFLPDSLKDNLDVNCADVAGPCFSIVLNLISVNPSQTVLDFLEQNQSQQNGLTRHAHAPFLKVMEALGTNDTRTGTGDMIPDLFRRQTFNWAPGVGSKAGNVKEHENIEILQSLSRADANLMFRAGLAGDGETFVLQCRWDDANTKREEIEEMMEKYGRLVRWVCEEQNWERSIGETEECLRGLDKKAYEGVVEPTDVGWMW